MMASFNEKNNKNLKNIKNLLKHVKFDYKSPNKLRAVLSTFQKNNIELFHSKDGSGYDFIANQIKKIDRINPQVSARLILPLTQFSNFNLERKILIKKRLNKMMDLKLSKYLYEILEKAIN